MAHTWHYHRHQRTSGHVWQGRFKSPVIQDDAHALVVLRYIETNPLRAGMVTDLAAYPWSSYAAHGLGQPDPLLSILPAWQAVRREECRRQAWWRQWLQTPLTEAELAAVRRSVVSGRPYGDATWVKTTAAALGLTLSERPRARPRKEQGKQNCSENLCDPRA